MACWISDLDSNITTTTDRELRYAVWDGVLQNWSPSNLATYSDEDKNSPSIAFDNNDNALIVWVGGNESINRIYLVSRDKVTGLWSDPEIVREDTTFIEYPAINVDADNNAVVVWRGFEDDSSELGDYFSDLDQNQNYTVGDFAQRDDYISQLNEQNMTKVYFDGEICYATKELSTPGAAWSEVKYLTSDNKTDWMVSAVIIRGHSNDLILVWDKEGSLSNLVHALEPDLAIGASDIMFSNNHPVDGENVNVTATVVNIGDVGAHDVLVEFFDGDPRSGGTRIGSPQQIDYLPYDGRINVTIRNRFGPGAHEIYVVIDRSGSIKELDESNNIAYNTITILPDLSLSYADITFSNTTPSAGDEITISAIIHNQGGTSAESTNVSFFSNNSLIGSDTVTVGAGEYEMASVPWIAAAGYNNITVVIDPTNLIAEWNETNNDASTSISILPDLSVERINLSNNDLLKGETLDISAKIMNIGAADATGVLVELFDGNPFVDGNMISSQTIDVLTLGGGSSSFTFNWAPPVGIHQVFVLVDRENLIAECNETNNIQYQEFVVRSLPDLNISESEITYESGSLKIVVPVKNDGEAGAANVIVGLYDGNPKPSGEMMFSDSILYISPGQVSSVRLVLNQQPMTEYLYIVVDLDDVIAESDETNNEVVLSYASIPQIDAGPDQVVDEGTKVTFSGSVILPGDSKDYSYTWDFGDGPPTVTEDLTPDHVYGDNGTYVVTLTVLGLHYSGVDQMTVTVQNVAPTVNAGPDMTVDEGTPLTFTGGFSDPGWLDTHAIEWDFGDGSQKDTESLIPTHTYADDGTYTVSLMVTDDDGGVGTDSVLVMVQNVNPIAQAGPDQTIDEDQVVTFDASASSDTASDLPLLTYTWDFGDGNTATGLTVSHIYLNPGIYDVTLTVKDDDGGIGTDSCLVYVLDKTPPETTLHVGTPVVGEYVNSSTPIDLTADDVLGVGVASIYYKINDGPWQTFSSSIYLSGDDGQYVLYYYAIDLEGNAEEADSATFILDNSPPTTTIHAGSPKYNSYVTSDTPLELDVTDSGSDVSLTYYCINGGTWNTYTGEFTLAGPDGPYTVGFYSVDRLGNSESVQNALYILDNSQPLSSITLSGDIGDNSWYISSVSITISFSDGVGSGVAAVYYILDAGEVTLYTGKFEESENKDPHNIEYWSVDNLGNTESPHNTYSFKIDAEDPVTLSSLQPTSPDGNNDWYISPVELTLNPSDTPSGVFETYYRVNGGLDMLYTDKVLFAEDGKYTVEYWSVDNAGNVETAIPIYFQIDQTAPETILEFKTNYVDQNGGMYLDSTTNISLSTEPDLSQIAISLFRINGGEWTEYNEPINLEGPIGTYTIEYYSQDFAGNTESVKVIRFILEDVFEGYCRLRIGRECFKGQGKLFLSEHLIRIELDDQIVTWEIVKHIKKCKLQIIKGKGVLGRITVKLYKGTHLVFIKAKGRGVFFHFIDFKWKCSIRCVSIPGLFNRSRHPHRTCMSRG